PACPTSEEFAEGQFADAPRLPDCLQQGAWSIEGHLIRIGPLEDSPYAGEPAWLANAPEYALVGAIGPAVTSWQLPIHLDPAAEIEVDESWISDRDAHEGPRVSLTGIVRHEQSVMCRLAATDVGMAHPTEQQAHDFCEQRFVVADLRPSSAEGP
ncbi:MAG: hypothetical protein ABR593_02940, partial [Candidatus Limnocylindria bacterium]